ncbi:hypothetical protein Ancab_038251 [Ancistrocladus abbreviatus]
MSLTVTLPAAGAPLQGIGSKLSPSAEEFSLGYIPFPIEKPPPSPQVSPSPTSSHQHNFCSYAPPALFPLPPTPPLLPSTADIKFSPFYLYLYHDDINYYYFNSSYFPVCLLLWQYASPFITSKVLIDRLCCYVRSLHDGYAQSTVDPCKGEPVIIEMAPDVVENGCNKNDGRSESPMESGVQCSVKGFPNRGRRFRSAKRNIGASRAVGAVRRGHCNAMGKFEWKPRINITCYPFGNKTTLMIRNIPNRLSRRELLDLLDAHCREENKNAKDSSESSTLSEFDFVYLPVDFKRGLNYGFAFVNFTTVDGAFRLLKSWNGMEWHQCGHNSMKIREIACAYIQGKEQLKKRFKSSVFACEDDEYLPVELSPPGNGNGWSRTELITIGTRGRHANTTAAITKPHRV